MGGRAGAGVAVEVEARVAQEAWSRGTLLHHWSVKDSRDTGGHAEARGGEGAPADIEVPGGWPRDPVERTPGWLGLPTEARGQGEWEA